MQIIHKYIFLFRHMSLKLRQPSAKINYDLELIYSISTAHRLVLNEEKSKIKIFGKGRENVLNNPHFQILINGTPLYPIMTCKNLGLFIDSDLRFASHVSSLIQKTYGKLRLLYMHRDVFNRNSKIRTP